MKNFGLLNQSKQSKIWINYFIIIAYLASLFFAPILAHAIPVRSYEGKINSIPFVTKIYIIKSGDTFEKLAQTYNIAPLGLAYLNYGNLDKNMNAPLRVGTRIILPAIPLSVDMNKKFSQQIMLKNVQARPEKFSNLGWFSRVLSSIWGQKDVSQASKQVQNNLFNGSSTYGSSAMSNWLNRYGTANVRLNLERGFHFGDSGLDVLLPLYDRPTNLVFTQGSFSRIAERMQMNLGFGNRYFIPNAMFGANGFFDYDFSGKHARLGLGAEYWRDYLHLALNGYFAMTNWKGSDFVEKAVDSVSDIFYQERAVNGFDVQGEAYLPMHPQLGAFASFEQYFGQEVAIYQYDKRYKNPNIVNVGLSYTPIPLVSFKAAYKHAVDDQSGRLAMDVTYRFGVPLATQIAFGEVDNLRRLQGSRYDLVQRNNNIMLEYQREDLDIRPNSLIKAKVGKIYALFEKVILSKNWKVKAWENDSKLELNDACYAASNLSECKIYVPEDIPADKLYSLKLTLLHKRTGVEKNYTIEVHVIDETVKIEAVTDILEMGKPFHLFSNVHIGSAWQIKENSWQKPDNFTLSPDCNDAKNLIKCQVTISSVSKNRAEDEIQSYQLKFSLAHEDSNEIRDITVPVKVKISHFMQIEVNTLIEAEAGQSYDIFKKAIIHAPWKVKSWKISPDLTLSKACYEAENLMQCKVTMPTDKTDDILYSVEVAFEDTVTQKEESHAFKIDLDVDKATILFQDIEQLKSFEQEEINLFKEIKTSNRWSFESWDTSQSFIDNGGSLSKECNTLATLAQCKVKLPFYQNKNDDYLLGINLKKTKLDGTTKIQSWAAQVSVVKPITDLNAQFEPLKTDPIFQSTTEIKLSLKAADDKPIDIPDAYLEKRLHFYLMKNGQVIKPDVNKDGLLENLRKNASGSYSIDYKAGDRVQEIEIGVDYFGNYLTKLPIKVTNDLKNVSITLSNPYFMLAHFDGLKGEYKILATPADGRILTNVNFRVQLLDNTGAIVTDAMDTTHMDGDGETGLKATFSATKIGQYKFNVQYRPDEDSEFSDVAQVPVIFTDGVPSSVYSKIVSNESEIAINDSAQYPTKTNIRLTIYDQFKVPLDYDLLTSDKSFKQKLKALIYKQASPARQNPNFKDDEINFVHDESNNFTYSFDSGIYKTSGVGIYNIDPTFDDVKIGDLQANVDVTQNLSVPDSYDENVPSWIVNLGESNSWTGTLVFSVDDLIVNGNSQNIYTKINKNSGSSECLATLGYDLTDFSKDGSYKLILVSNAPGVCHLDLGYKKKDGSLAEIDKLKIEFIQ